MVGIPLSGGAGELHCLGSSPLWAGRCKFYLGALAYLLDHHSPKFTANLAWRLPPWNKWSKQEQRGVTWPH